MSSQLGRGRPSAGPSGCPPGEPAAPYAVFRGTAWRTLLSLRLVRPVVRDPSEGGGAASCVSVRHPSCWPSLWRPPGVSPGARRRPPHAPDTRPGPHRVRQPADRHQERRQHLPGRRRAVRHALLEPAEHPGQAPPARPRPAATSTTPPASAASASPTSPARAARAPTATSRSSRTWVRSTSSPASDTKTRCTPRDFSHADETAEPGYYKVGLACGVTAELTATARTGSGRFTYPADKPATLLVRTSNSESGRRRLRTSRSTRRPARSPAPSRRATSAATSTRRANATYYTLYFTARFDRASGDRHLEGRHAEPGRHRGERRHRRIQHRRPAGRGQGLGRLRHVRARHRPGERQGRHLLRQPGERRGQPRAPRTRRPGPSTPSRTQPAGPGAPSSTRSRSAAAPTPSAPPSTPRSTTPCCTRTLISDVDGRYLGATGKVHTAAPGARRPSTAPSPAGTSTARRCSC